jgi:pimeloyl-ACP methyl ester carboxylesterase
MQLRTARHVLRLVRGWFGVQPLIVTLLENAVRNADLITSRLVGRYVAPYVGREGVNHFLTLARSLDDADLEGLQLEAIAQPTLVLSGDEDRWCSAVAAADLASQLRAGRSDTVPGAGRLLAEDAPDALLRAILSVEDRRPAAGGTG